MRLQEYWGVGPKTADLLETELGVERAVRAIESADVGTLVDAGLPRGRATRILRRATGAAGLDTLGTGDARDVYGDLLELAAQDALTHGAADRIRVLTPLPTQEAAADRLDRVDAATEIWAGLDDERAAVIEAFEQYDAAGAGRRAAVDAVLDLRSVGSDEAGPFDRLADLDPDALADAVDALGAVDGEVATEGDDSLSISEGADDRLDELRSQLAAARRLNDAALDVLETVRGQDVRSLEAFQSGVISYVAEETGSTPGEVRSIAPDDARDETDFVSETLRALVGDLEEQVTDREATVASDLEETLDDAGGEIEAAVVAIDDLAFDLSLARFAAKHDLTRPELVADGLAVRNARNLFIEGEIQPITYGVGDHGVAGNGSPSPPSGDRVTVLTGANSGGKTTLLETLCAVALLAALGLPVPAEEAEVGRFDTIVFHRRHASFNAGVLESTLRSVVPPLTGEGRALMLVDEFEAITEPGRAADLLNGLVDLTVDRGALGVFVTHLAADLSPLPDTARIDGIFAEGLTDDLDLRVDYQPRFGTVGRSTPEFIVSRLVANARDRDEREAFRAIAAAVGEEAVQRTLSDAEWQA
jgi:dsDNA-specific endonuclease/ATPase MutS2